MNTITKEKYKFLKSGATGTYIGNFQKEIHVIDSGWTQDTLLILNDADLKVCRVVDLILDATMDSVVAWHLMYIDDDGSVADVYTTDTPTFHKDLQDAQSGKVYHGQNTFTTWDDCVKPSIDKKYCDKYHTDDVESAWTLASDNHYCQFTYDESANTMTYYTWDGLNAIVGSTMICPRFLYDDKDKFCFGNSSFGYMEDGNTYRTKEDCEADNMDNVKINGFEDGEISQDTKNRLFTPIA